MEYWGYNEWDRIQQPSYLRADLLTEGRTDWLIDKLASWLIYLWHWILPTDDLCSEYFIYVTLSAFLIESDDFFQ